MSNTTPTLPQLQKALAIAERIQTLEGELANLISGKVSEVSAGSSSSAPVQPSGKRVVSKETRAKMKAPQQARRARAGGNSSSTLRAPKQAKQKRVLSPEGRARIVEALKRRHAAKRRSGK